MGKFGIIILRYGDTELSKDTFLRAQSVAPQDAQSWLGHAVAADILGEENKASGYYVHAFTLSKGRLALAQFLYGLSVVNKSQGRDPRDIETAQNLALVIKQCNNISNIILMMRLIKYCVINC